MNPRRLQPLPHAVRRQDWEVNVTDPDLAFTLRSRFSDWNRERWLPRIEQVLDEMDTPGTRHRLGRLEIDLGTVSPQDLGTVVGERLEQELRRVLQEKIASESPAASSLKSQSCLPEQTAWLELFEHYLLRGMLPFWSPRRTFSLSRLTRQLASEAPQALKTLIRRHGRRRRVLERLVAQLDRESFHALLHALDPGHAALLVAYLLDVGETHRRSALLPIGERELERTLGVLTLTYLVAERGSRFNRRSYVRSLVRGLASARGLAYVDLLRTLGQCLDHRKNPHLLRSSLPEVIVELLQELDETLDSAVASRDARRSQQASAEQLRAALIERLSAGATPTSGGGDHDEQIAELLGTMIDQHPAPARRFLESLRHHDGHRAALIRHSPTDTFEQILEILCPDEAEDMSVLMHALARVPSPYRPRTADVREAILSEVFRVGQNRPFDETMLANILNRLFESPLPAPVAGSLDRELGARSARLPEARRSTLRAAVAIAAGRSPGRSQADTTERSTQKPTVQPGSSGHHPDESLSAKTVEPLKTESKSKVSPPDQDLPDQDQGDQDVPDQDTLYIDNAGLVIAAAYLPHLFSNLDLLSDDLHGKPRLRDLSIASRAVHALCYLVDGRASAPEPELALPKILCGWPVEAPVDRQIEPSETDLELCDRLLNALVVNWQSLGSASPAGLQETFFQRQGRLQHKPDGWHLDVQRKTVDVLVDQLPWSISVIFHRWMEAPLHVSW